MAGLVLYIDDALELPEGTARELSRVGYELVHTSDPEEALRLVREREPRVVLVEVLLASGAGLDLVERIRAGERPAGRLPIVVVTRGERSPELYGRAIELGVNDYLCKPVLRPEIVAAVLECAESEEAASPDDAVAPESGATREETFCGDLARDPVPELLWRLHRTGATGVLMLRRDGDSLGVQLRNGSPVAVAKNRGSESIEDYLVRTKRIADDVRETVIEQVTLGMGDARGILLGMDALPEREIDAAFRQRAAEPLLESFGWTSGSHRFESGKRLKASQANDLDQSPGHLLLDGVLQWLPAEAVRRLLDRRAGLYVSRDEQPAYPLEELGSSRCDPELLETLNGDRSVAELLDSGAVEARLLYGLLVTGLVQAHPDPVLMLTQEVSPARADAPADGAERAAPRVLIGIEAVETAISNVARRISSQNDFGVLEVSEDATGEEVREAYERMKATVPLEKIPAEAESLLDLARKVRDRIEKAYEHLRDDDSRRAFAALSRERTGAQEGEREARRSLEAEQWFRKGKAFLEGKRYAQAVEAFGMASHLDPTEGDYLAHLGYSLYLSNPTNELVQREALEHIAKGVKRSPEREKPLVFLARIFRAKGEPENARKVLRRALKLKPDCYEALQEMGLLDLRATKQKGLLDRFLKR